MANTTCGCGYNCTFFAVLGSLIIGIVAAILRIMGIVTETSAFLWVTFGIAIVVLILTLITANSGTTVTRRCAGSKITALLVGILGTVLTSVILLAVNFSAASVIGAVIIGALLTFFTLIITSIACIIKCLTSGAAAA